MQTIKLKRGDPLSIAAVRRDAEAQPISLVGATILSQVRTPVFSDDLNVAVSDEAGGAFNLVADGAQTSDWPVGSISWDVRFVGGVQPGSTETVQILVEEDVTRAS